MKRYRLTKSGVCDCMLPDDNGPWVKYEDAEQAHCEGWEQAKREAACIAEMLTYEFTNESAFNRGYLRASTECMEQIASMEYKEQQDDRNS